MVTSKSIGMEDAGAHRVGVDPARHFRPTDVKPALTPAIAPPGRLVMAATRMYRSRRSVADVSDNWT
jgi:hypothetical protein